MLRRNRSRTEPVAHPAPTLVALNFARGSANICWELATLGTELVYGHLLRDVASSPRFIARLNARCNMANSYCTVASAAVSEPIQEVGVDGLAVMLTAFHPPKASRRYVSASRARSADFRPLIL